MNRFTYPTGLAVPHSVFPYILGESLADKLRNKISKSGISIQQATGLKARLAEYEAAVNSFFWDNPNGKPDELRAHLDREFGNSNSPHNASQTPNLEFIPFVTWYIDKAEAGEILTAKERPYSKQSVKNLRVFESKMIQFDNDVMKLRWDNLDRFFKDGFISFLQKSNYSHNYISSQFARLKMIINFAKAEGIDQAKQIETSGFKSRFLVSDDIALAVEEVDRLFHADLSNGEAKARDLFLIGVYTAQRVSDYTRYTPENFKVVNDIEVIEIHQMKQDVKVMIPVHHRLKAIMERNNYQSPKLSQQKLNQYIKTASQKAGIDSIVVKSVVKGGKRYEERSPKYELISSHTARRTGATLLYKSGLGVKTLMQITGHQKVSTLMDYIKIKLDASSIESIAGSSFFKI